MAEKQADVLRILIACLREAERRLAAALRANPYAKNHKRAGNEMLRATVAYARDNHRGRLADHLAGEMEFQATLEGLCIMVVEVRRTLERELERDGLTQEVTP